MVSKTLGCSSRKFARLRQDYPSIGLFAQALYPLLIANSDDFGRQQGDAFTVKHAVWSTAPEHELAFDEALQALDKVGLVSRYTVDGAIYLHIIGFEEHQQGLHKRVASRFPEPPGNSRNFPEIPGDSLLREQNRTEQKGTEGKVPGTSVPEPPARAPVMRTPEPDARSKRPIFTGQRLTVFEWQLDDCIRTLGKHLDAFDLHAWFSELDVGAVAKGLVIPKRDGGAWLQAQLVAEAQKRGIPLQLATVTPQKPDDDAVWAAIAKKGPSVRP